MAALRRSVAGEPGDLQNFFGSFFQKGTHFFGERGKKFVLFGARRAATVRRPIHGLGRLVLAIAGFHGTCGAAPTPLLITNDDTAVPYPPSTISIRTIGADGTLGHATRVSTEGNGVAGGYFGANRLLVTTIGAESCIFAANAQSESITGFSVDTAARTGVFHASHADTSLAANGIPLAATASRLYAGFSGGGNIGAFEKQAGCRLRFLGDTAARGLSGGAVQAIAANGATLVAAYGDGSVESFAITGVLPASHGDAAYAAGRDDDFTPGAVDITSNGKFAIFGGGSTTTTVQVAALTDGRLGAPTTYKLAGAWNAGSVRLSPDESVLFISNSSGGRVTAAFFDPSTGALRSGCTSAALRGFYAKFTYIGAIATQNPTSPGGLLYVPEFNADGNSAIGILQFNRTGTGCTLRETAQSPVAAGPNAALLSLAIFPPRPF